MKRVKDERGQLGTVRHAAERAAAVVALLCCQPASTPEAQAAAVSGLFAAYGEPAPALAVTELPALRQAATDLYAVFAAASVAEAAQRLNAIFATQAGPPRLTAHEGTPWHLHIDASDDAPWAPWFLASSALALALLLAERQQPPGSICAAPACGRPFITSGPGRARRYCSSRCATRARVAAHRQRQAQQ